jgi:hypothetical protein
MSVGPFPCELQTKLAAETHLAEGQWLEEQQNVEKLRMFREGTRSPTVSRNNNFTKLLSIIFFQLPFNSEI